MQAVKWALGGRCFDRNPNNNSACRSRYLSVAPHAGVGLAAGVGDYSVWRGQIQVALFGRESCMSIGGASPDGALVPAVSAPPPPSRAPIRSDLGCHIDGYIAVVAQTIIVPPEEGEGEWGQRVQLSPSQRV